MPSKKLIVGCVLALGVTAWLVVGDDGQPASPPPANPALVNPVATRSGASRQDDSVQAAIADLQAQVRALSSAHPSATPPVEAGPETPEESDAAMTDMANRLDDVLGQEARDPEWDAAMQARVQTFFQPDSGARVLQMDCRASLCRVDIGLDDVHARDELARRSPDLLEDGAELFGYVDSPGDLEVSLYLSRGGTALPAM